MKAVWVLLAICVVLVICFFQLQRMISHGEQGAVQLAAADLPPSGESEKKVRKPAVAGAFYPRDSGELATMVDEYLADAGPQELPGKLIGLMAPHAGYVYSGPVAGFSYGALKGKQYDTVVVIGPSHSVRLPGAALTESDYWETPLGQVQIDRELGARLAELEPRFVEDDRVQRREHSIEVQVPFLQRTLRDFKLLPIQVWDFSLENCGAISHALVAALEGKNALLVASTDMTHYPAYDEACRIDKKTLELIRDWRIRDLPKWELEATASGVPELHCALCGLGPVMIVMDASRRLGANVAQVLKYANSGDVPVGDKRRCVGYGAVVFCEVEGQPAPKTEGLDAPTKTEVDKPSVESSEGELNEEQQKYLLSLARRAINNWVTKRERARPQNRDGIFGEKRAVFVTIEEHGELRGCIGSLTPQEPLVDAIVSRAIAAATTDPRFPPVQRGELPHLKLHVSVLSPVKPISDPSEIVIGKHGVIVKQGFRSGVFLPEVAVDQGWDRETMLSHLCAGKAGLPPDAWRKGAKLSVFTTQNFGD